MKLSVTTGLVGHRTDGTEPADRRASGTRMRSVVARLLQVVVVLFVVSIATFWLVQVVPGNPGRNALGLHATPEQVRVWNVRHGLDGGTFDRYIHWLNGFIHGNWGTSIVYGEPVAEMVGTRFLNSVLVGLLAFALLAPLSAVVGCVQAYFEGRRTDRALTAILSALSAMPEFVVGVVFLIAFSVVLHVIRTQASPTEHSLRLPLSSMILPATVLAISYVPVLARMVRTGVIGALGSAYHRTAVLKGLSPYRIVWRHVTRNALIPTVSMLGIYLGALLSGNAVVEWVFGYPGLGALTVTAALKKDVLLLEACVMVIGISCLLALLLTDLVLVWLDRRITL